MIPSLTNHLWQSTLFALVAGLLTLAFRGNRAQVRYWLWFSASIKFFIPLALLMSLGSRFEWDPAASNIATPAVSQAIEQVAEPFPETVQFAPPIQGKRDWFPVAILALWSCGFTAIALIRLRGWLRIRAAVRASVPMEIPANVVVRAAPGLLEPGVVGCLRPILLVPEGIADRLTPLQLEAVLAHELCHVRRRDNLTSAIHMIVEAIFWFHPLVWWIGARLVEERERACDEGVLSLGNEPQVYAEAILNVCKLYVESPLACVSGVTGSDLKKRIEAIMTNRIARRLNFAKKVALAVAGVAALAVPMVVGMMNVKPVRAQSPPPAIKEAPVEVVPPPQIVPPPPKKYAAQIVIHQAPAGQVMPTSVIPPPPPAPRPVFEVASIKPCAPGETGAGGRGGGGGRNGKVGPGGSGPSPDRLTTGCQSLVNFMRQAYITFASGHAEPMGYTVIDGGPAWINSDRYQISAKAEGTAGQEMMRGPMLQTLLEERFQLKMHRETREVPAYSLTVMRNGPKLDAYDEATCLPPPMPPPKSFIPTVAGQKPYCGITWVERRGANTVAYMSGATLDQISRFLGSLMDRPVFDKTGIAGKFIFNVEYLPDASTPTGIMPRNGESDVPVPSDLSGGPSIFAAVQQLGLKLEPSKGSREFIVIDSAQKPSEN